MLLKKTDLDRLPHLYEQEAESDPMLHAKLVTTDRRWTCYIAEASEKDGDTYVFALFVSARYGYNWAQLPLHDIEDDLRNAGLQAHLDTEFQPNRASVLTGIRRREFLDEL
jgi:hypothetical protein